MCVCANICSPSLCVCVCVVWFYGEAGEDDAGGGKGG